MSITIPAVRRREGFTIVELLIVIVVIGILAAITIVAYNGIQQRARDTESMSDLTNAAKKLELYNAEFGSYPASIGQAVTMKVRFSYTPVSTTVLLCGNSTGYALFQMRNNKQYKIQTGQPVQEVTPMLAWSSAPVCASTVYPALAWGYSFVDGG